MGQKDDSSSKKQVEYTYGDVRKHAHTTDAWIAIHGKVYDVTKFLSQHPGGAIINTAFGRDGTILFETHHNCCDMDKVNQVMGKYQIGVIQDYKPCCIFDSPFAKTLMSRVKDKIKGRHLRDSWYSYT